MSKNFWFDETARTQEVDVAGSTVERLVDFGFKDSKGRALGAVIVTGECHYVDDANDERNWYSMVKPGHYFYLYTQATRDGKTFGASQSRSYFKTTVSREFAITAYLKGAAKRAAKRAGN